MTDEGGRRWETAIAALGVAALALVMLDGCFGRGSVAYRNRSTIPPFFKPAACAPPQVPAVRAARFDTTPRGPPAR
jgi:hypothetical protein